MSEVKAKLGIEHLKLICVAGGQVYDAIQKSKADGKIDFNDLGNFVPVLIQIKPLIDGGKFYLPEFQDLDQAEIDELMLAVAEAVPGLKGAAPIILRIKASLNLLRAGYEAYETFAGKSDPVEAPQA